MKEFTDYCLGCRRTKDSEDNWTKLPKKLYTKISENFKCDDCVNIRHNKETE